MTEARDPGLIRRLTDNVPGANLSGIRPDIEGLRAVAILLVVAYHAGVPGFAGGFTGVDVFFVLSGYLITGLLMKEVSRTGRIELLRFYGRRARRLLPAAGLILVVTLVLGRLLASPLEMKRIAASGVATAFYASNVYFIRQSTDYLAGAGHDNPLLHTWSLAVEEQFYLAWPLLILAGAALVRRARSPNRLPLTLGSVALVSLAGSVYLTHAVQPWAFFGSPPRAWEFATGGLAALIPAARRYNAASRIAGWAGLAVIGTGAVLIGPTTPFPGLAALAPVIGTALVLAACAGEPLSGAGSYLALGPLQTIGRLSYSWYLWHWPLLVYGQRLGLAESVPARLALVTAALGASALAYRFFENPIRHNRFLVPRPALTLILAAGLTLSLGVMSGVSRLEAIRILATPEHVALAAAQETPPAPAGCRLGYQAVDGDQCQFGDTAGTALVVLFGDSHAEQWVPTLDRLGASRGWRVRLLSKSACPAPLIDVRSPVLNRLYTECSEWRSSMIDRIVDWKPDMVVVTSSNLYPLETEQYGVTLDGWRAGWLLTLTRLKRSGARVVMLRDTPHPGFNVPECLSRRAYSPFGGSGDCFIRRTIAVDDAVSAVERSVAGEVPGVAVVDLTREFCDDVQCSPVIDGRVVYRDANHVAVEFSRSLRQPFADALDASRAGGPVRQVTRSNNG